MNIGLLGCSSLCLAISHETKVYDTVVTIEKVANSKIRVHNTITCWKRRIKKCTL